MDIVIHAKSAVVDGQLQDNVYIGIVKDRIAMITHDLDSTLRNYQKPIMTAEIALPGFIDIHNHGLGGAVYIIDSWSNPDFTLQRLPAAGTTCVLASIVPADIRALQTIASALRDRFDKSVNGASVVAGYHAEGPCIAELGMGLAQCLCI